MRLPMGLEGKFSSTGMEWKFTKRRGLGSHRGDRRRALAAADS